MKRSLTLLFLIAIFTQVELAAQSLKNSSIREVKFIDLKDSANVLFWGSYREIPRLVMTAIKNGSIKPFIIDYNKKSVVTFLSLPEFEQRIILFSEETGTPADEFYFTSGDYLFASDLPYIGLDQTISIVDGEERINVHYVNFYNHESVSKDAKTREYRFSVTWEDFINVLKQRLDLLYTPNIYGAWWRGDVFITNGRYLLETTTSDFIELSRSQGIPPKDFTNLNEVQTVDSLNRKNYDPSLMDLYVIEEQKQNAWKINRLAFGTVPYDVSYLNERRFMFEWSDFLKVLENKERTASKDIYTLADAFLLQKFEYTDTIQSIPISKNGKFKKGGKDGLCVSSLNESFKTFANTVSYMKFHTQLQESLYLGDTANVLLNIPGHSIAEIIHTHVMDGTLVSYEDDSIKRSMTPEKFKSNATQYLDVPEIEYGGIYEKGDTVRIYIHDGDYWYGESRYFIVQEQFKGTDFRNDSNLISKLKRYYPPLIPIEELNVIDFRNRLSFDQNGNNKKYKLEDVVLYVSADGLSNIKGIQYSLCYVHWQDLKSVLLKDPRATFMYKGHQVSLIDVIENRAYLSIFLKTGYVEIGE